MKRPLKPDEVQLWSLVLDTVEPAPGRVRPKPPEPPPAPVSTAAKPDAPAAAAPASVSHRRRLPAGIHGIEPNRARRISLGREVIARRLDLHGYGQDAARSTLERFITEDLPLLNGKLATNLRGLLDDLGVQHLEHGIPGQSYTLPQALGAISWLVGRRVPLASS